MPAYSSGSDEMRKQSVIAGLVPYPARDDRRMNTEPLGEFHHSERGGAFPDTARTPDIGGNEAIFRPLVGLLFFRISRRALDVTKAQVIDESIPFRLREVAADMRKFVQQAEPEII